MFEVSDLNINPAEVEIGEEVTISVTVINVGLIADSYLLNLKINDEIIESKFAMRKVNL